MTIAHYPRLAYGDWTVEDCPCPALAAGYDTQEIEGINTFIDHFDRTAMEEFNDGSWETETASAEAISDVWIETIEYVEDDENFEDHVAEAGRTVARELGWLEE